MKNTCLQPWHIERACQSLARGELIAYPTEAVWGLGCDPDNEQALVNLLALKQRSWKKGLILVCAQLDDVMAWLKPLTDEQLTLINAPCNEPTTWILPAKRWVSCNLKGAHDALAVRITHHPDVAALCRAFGPMVSTSANIAGVPVAKTEIQLRASLHDLGYVVPGRLGGHTRPSQIRTLAGTVLR